MKTATLEELKADPDCLERWISAGEEVRIVKDGTPFANVVPFQKAEEEQPTPKRPFELPDFRARRKRIQQLNEGRAEGIEIEALRDDDERSFAKP